MAAAETKKQLVVDLNNVSPKKADLHDDRYLYTSKYLFCQKRQQA
jgi:hypothetical protein